MKLTHKKNLLIYILLLFFLTVTAFFLFWEIKMNMYLKTVRQTYLQNATHYKAEAVKEYLNLTLNKLKDIEKRGEVEELLQKYLNDGKISEDITSNAIKELKEIGDSVAVFTPDGYILASSKSQPNTDYSDSGFLNRVKNGDIFTMYYDQYDKKYLLAILDPVLGDGKIKAISGITLNMDTLARLSMSEYELYNSDFFETYLVDENGILLTQSKFLKNTEDRGVLTQKVDSPIVDMCKKQINDPTLKYSEDIHKYVNYLGNNVLGVFEIIPSANWCLISEYNFD